MEDDPAVKDVAASIDREAREKKATKSDKAPVPHYYWRDHLLEEHPSGFVWPEWKLALLDHNLDWLRNRLFGRWARRLVAEFQDWWKRKHASSLRKCQKWASGRPSCVSWDPSNKRYIWNDRAPKQPQSLANGRSLYKAWSLRRHPKGRDLQAGRDCLHRAMNSTWWDWKAGSRPFFWRWNPESQELLRDGMMVCFVGEPPDYTEAQPSHRSFEP